MYRDSGAMGWLCAGTRRKVMLMLCCMTLLCKQRISYLLFTSGITYSSHEANAQESTKQIPEMVRKQPTQHASIRLKRCRWPGANFCATRDADGPRNGPNSVQQRHSGTCCLRLPPPFHRLETNLPRHCVTSWEEVTNRTVSDIAGETGQVLR